MERRLLEGLRKILLGSNRNHLLWPTQTRPQIYTHAASSIMTAIDSYTSASNLLLLLVYTRQCVLPTMELIEPLWTKEMLGFIRVTHYMPFHTLSLLNHYVCFIMSDLKLRLYKGFYCKMFPNNVGVPTRFMPVLLFLSVEPAAGALLTLISAWFLSVLSSWVYDM